MFSNDAAAADNDDDAGVFASVKEVVCFGEGAGANILTRFAVSICYLICVIQWVRSIRLRLKA